MNIAHPARFFVAFALAGALTGFSARLSDRASRAPGMAAATAAVAAAIPYSAPSPFDHVAPTARAAYVYDVATGKTLFEKNADAQLPLASLTKIMTAMTALSVAPRYALVSVLPAFLAAEGNSGLQGNEQWPLTDLLSFSLFASSNGGASAAAAAAGSFISANGTSAENKSAFVDAMNGEAKRLGLNATYFLNETGLDENAEIAGGYGSARDVAHLLAGAYRAHAELFDATTKHDARFMAENGARHAVSNTNKITEDIPLLRASKTGTTDLAGGNLAIMFDAGPAKPIAVVVLGSTETGRFDDVKELIAATFRFLQKDDPSL